jgi:hypothetical protein
MEVRAEQLQAFPYLRIGPWPMLMQGVYMGRNFCRNVYSTCRAYFRAVQALGSNYRPCLGMGPSTPKLRFYCYHNIMQTSSALRMTVFSCGAPQDLQASLPARKESPGELTFQV